MKKRVLLFGDSNTWGYISGSDDERYDEDTRWSGRLQALLGDGYTVIEEGHNGRATVWDDEVENRMAGFKYLWPCMESQSPFDLLVIMLGTNDTKTYFSMTAHNIADGAGRLARLALGSPFGREHRPPKVLIVSPILVEDNPTTPMFGQQAAEKSRSFADNFRRVADQLGLPFLDAALYAKPGEADGLHIRREDHPVLAAAMAEKVKEILG